LVEKLGNNAFGWNDNLFKKDDVINLGRAKKKRTMTFLRIAISLIGSEGLKKENVQEILE
jgi:hypothetical protein